MVDFTLKAYKKLLETLVQAGYEFYTFDDWCEKEPIGKIVILRHDVDRSPKNALKVAKLEHELGIKSTYYFLIKGFAFRPDIVQQIATLGHEIGYHYRDLVKARGEKNKAILFFENNLNLARTIVPIKTIAMDGCPWSKYDNRDLWREYDYRNYGLVGEPYFDFINKDVLYYTDTARMWNGDKYNIRDKKVKNSLYKESDIKTTFDFIFWIRKSNDEQPIMITTHPQRWTDSPMRWSWELCSQRIKNAIKYFLLKF